MALPSLDRPQPLDEDPEAILVASDLLDVVAEVRPHDARPHDLEVATERGGDLRRRGRGRGGGHAEHGRIAERLERAPDEQVVGPEVVPPHADAVHLVDHDEADADRAQRLDECGVAEPLGRGVEQPRAARRRRRGSVPAVPPGSRDELTNVAVAAISGGSLSTWSFISAISGERTSVGSRPQHRGELVGERLAGAGRHQRQRVAALDGGADDLLLPGPEVVEAEETLEVGPEIGHANECTERIGTTSCRRATSAEARRRRAWPSAEDA